MADDTTYMRTFRRAIETLGSTEKLAKALGASIGEVEAWAAGHMVPPPGAFLAAIDIVARGPVTYRGPVNT
jgi:DNA-binding transcriptional regulator YiaG